MTAGGRMILKRAMDENQKDVHIATQLKSSEMVSNGLLASGTKLDSHTEALAHNTLSNGCAQAIISCPKSPAMFAVRSVSRNAPRNTTLAVGTGNGVVAQCGHDRKWHTSSLSMKSVTVHTVDCIKLLPIKEHEPARRVANIDPDDSGENGSGDVDDVSFN
uniref:Uncharacterized protein n=1 Tax=Angiostrongylus cantonensis TaxID=6313 RepID=A0A0K0D105_ANGCA